jgi:uncharacterized protein
MISRLSFASAASTSRQARTMRLAAFFIAAYALSWLIWIPQAAGVQGLGVLTLLAGCVPSLMGVLFIYLESGKAGLERLFSRLTRWYLHWKWYLVALGGPVSIFLLALTANSLLGGPTPQYLDPAHIITRPGQWYLGFVVFAWVFVFSALGEEIGWRGYALPHLTAYFGNLRASLLLGIIWGFWHLPLFFIASNFHANIPFTWFLLQIVASSILYTWLIKQSRESLLIALLFHTAGNVAVGLLPVLPADVGGSMTPLWLAVGLEWFAVALVLVFDKEMR